MKIAVLVLDQVFDTGLSTLLDTLALANGIAASEKINAAHFDVSLVAVRRKVATGQGLLVPVAGVQTCLSPDVVLLPALNNKATEAVCESLGRRDVAEAGEQLKAWSAQGAVLGAACNATFLLAETKLLDGQNATTTWWHAARFRERYPRVALDASPKRLTALTRSEFEMTFRPHETCLNVDARPDARSSSDWPPNTFSSTGE